MFRFRYLFFVCVTTFSASNLFDHATKQYADFLTAQSPEKAKIAQTILNAASTIKEVEQPEKKDSEDSNDVEVDQKTFDELRLICAKSGSPFLGKINPKTAIGFAHLIKLLTKPTTDTEELQRRQKVIEVLSNNPKLLAKLSKLLNELKEHEQFFVSEPLKPISLFQKFKTFSKETSFGLFFKLIDIYSLEDSLIVLLSGGLLNSRINPSEFYESVKTLASQKSRIALVFSYNPLLPPWKRFIGFCFILINLKSLIAEILFFPDTIKNYLNSYLNNQKKQRAYKKLLTVYEASTSNQHILPIESYKEIPLKNLIFQLKKSTYNGNTVSYFANPYTIYQTKKLIEKNELILKNIYNCVGKADSLISLAQFYKDHECHFAHYSENKSPVLEISGGLHPNGLNYQNLVRNNFSHQPNKSCDQKQVRVISGKNGSGKSFNMKMVFVTAWMAQTVGFTLTDKQCIITPFDYFKIHANISDSDHYSKFETEKNELGQLLEKLAHLEQKNKRSFLIFDEPLSTTSSVIAEPITNTIIAMLKNSPYSLSFIITHLHAILANKDVRQMSIAVKPNEDGTFTSTRKFQDGPSYDNDAAQSLAQTLNPALRDRFLTLYKTETAKDTQKMYTDLQSKKIITDSDKN